MAQRVSALGIIQGAFGILNVFLPGEAIPGPDASTALAFLNDLLDTYGLAAQMSPVVSRNRFAMVAGKGSTSDPYTIGPTGDLAMTRPASQDSLVGANLILTGTTPETRVPLQLMTDASYDANPVPDTTSTQPLALYYNPTYASNLGSIYLWPVPTTGQNALELFVEEPIAGFADLSSQVWVPDGGVRMLKYNLAETLAGQYGKQMAASDQKIATSSRAAFQRSNVKLTDVANDAAGVGHVSGVYNILSDTFTR